MNRALEKMLPIQLYMQQEQLIQQQPDTYFTENEQLSGAFLLRDNDHCLGEVVVGQAMKPDTGMEIGGWKVDFGRVLNYGNGSESEVSYALPKTVSCPPAVAAAMVEVAAIATKRESFKKRKPNKDQYLQKFGDEEKSQDKKMKKCAEEEGSKITDQNSNITTCSTSNKNKKRPCADNVPKTDYIHVRARRGEATDSHSLAERARREKLSERMKYLQDLVPGCEKITGKAGMLDEIINYVQSLQKQVEFLSMKLAVINPRLEFDDDLDKEPQIIPAQIQFNALTQGVNPPDVTIRRTISAPLTIPDALFDSSCLNQQNQNLAWDAELQNLYNMEYQQGRSPTYISQPFTGYIEADNVKQEM